VIGAPPPEAPGRRAMRVPGAGAILDYARRLGWRRALGRSLYVAVNQILTLSIFDCFRLRREDVNEELCRAGGGFECRFLAPGELPEVAAQLDAEYAAALRAAVARGDEAYLVLDGGRLASIGLYAAGPAPLLDDLVVLHAPPARYMYRGLTFEAYRGKRLHALGILRAALELHERGVPELVTVCERTNYPATVSVLRMGWRPGGALYRVGLGRWSRLGGTAAARALGMRLALRSSGAPLL
jgi:hypothetical protein